MRLSGEEMVFHRLKIRYKGTNVAEINCKSIRGSVKIPKVSGREAIGPGDIGGPLPRWGLHGTASVLI